jgi:amino acid adenylation domain-containing protein
MSDPVLVHDYLQRAVVSRGQHPALEEPDGTSVSYADLARLSARVRDRLQAMGVAPGDRVGIWIRKTIDTVAAIFGTLECGAAYVPVDPGAPAVRNGYILANCGVRVAIVEERFAAGLRAEMDRAGHAAPFLVLPEAGGGRALGASLAALEAASPAPVGRIVRPDPGDLAYILYTSGSTGKPKGVMLSHRNATSFVDWCGAALAPQAEDRFSAHAPFHFDLSILDLFVSIKHGATLVLIGEELGRDPVRLAEFIARARISSWYSAPSILSLLAQRGELARHDYSRLRTVLFAGEVFPVVHLRALKKLWPHPRYFNLYGPTETNVCTYYEVPHVVPEDRADPYPIGKVCAHLRGIVVDADGRAVEPGQEGELCIAGPAVMVGYWNDPVQTGQRFVSWSGERWYRTGDVVVPDANGDYRFLGRRDRMVKKRGYRVELGEIETCLVRHPDVREAAVVALPHDELGLQVTAHLGTDAGKRLSIVQLKRFCSELLPTYMVPDRFEFHAVLPKTSTGKMDYQTLAER